MVLSGCDSEAEKVTKEAERKKTNAEYNCTSETMPFVQSQFVVKERLKAPSTADFPLLDFKDTYEGDCTHTVVSYVDSQNAFGAKIRAVYQAKLKYHKDSDRWELLELVLQEN